MDRFSAENYQSFDIPILNNLSEEFFIRKEELCQKLALPGIVIEGQIQQLRESGYNVLSDKEKGYRIISRPDSILPFEIKNKLTTSYIGKAVFYYPEVSSTNIIAREIAQGKGYKVPEGTIVISDKQNSGKGRSGKKWASPPGGIWLSILLYPETISYHISLITLMAAVVVANTIEKLFQIRAQIKWPNDILIKERKVCGILTEMGTVAKGIEWVIVGIGINANNDSTELPEDIQKSSISLKEITGKLTHRAEVVRLLCTEFERFYELLKRKEFSIITEKWKSFSNVIGKKIQVNTGNRVISGEAIDINDRGGLILKTEYGDNLEIISGTVLK